jgi:putative ABC transport system permease protein
LYKSVGFTASQVTRAILVEHLLIAVCAGFAGWMLATLVSPALRVGPLRLLDAGALHWDPAALVVTTAVTIVIVIVSTLVPAWRAGRVEVATALVGSTPGRRRRLSGASGWAGNVPPAAGFAVTALTARPLRAMFNVVAIVVAVVAAIVSVSILRSVDTVVLDPALTGDPADVVLEPSDRFAPSDVEHILDRTAAAGAWYPFLDDTATIAGGDVHLRAVGGDPATNGFVAGAGRLPSRAGEAAAGYGLLRARGWQLGDRVTLVVRDASVDVELVGWYRETEDSGEILQIRMEDYGRVAGDTSPAYGVIAAEQSSIELLAAALRDEFGTASSIRPNAPDGSGLTPFRVALGVMTVLIAAVALAHVTASIVTTQRESRRRLGIQRALGSEPSQLVYEAVIHGLALAALALLVGIPLGWRAQRAIGDLLTSEIGIGPGLTFGPTPRAMVAIAAVTLAGGAAATTMATLPSLRRPADMVLTED